VQLAGVVVTEAVKAGKVVTKLSGLFMEPYLHPALSVIVTPYSPAPKLTGFVVPATAKVNLLNQEYVNGGVPPMTVTVAVPSPGHTAGVDVIV
jgi:hypothetical protein